MKNPAYHWLTTQSKLARRYLSLSIFLGIFSGVIVIAQSGILAYAIDQVYLHQTTRIMLIHTLLIFLSLVILRPAITWTREIVSFRTAQIVKNQVRETVLKQLSHCTPIQLSQFKTAALTSTLIEQVEALHGFFADYLPQMSIVIMLPIIILIIVFLQNWVVGLLLLMTAPLIPLFMAIIGMNTAKLNQENFQTLSRMSAYFLDRLQGLTTLVLFNRAHAETQKIGSISEVFREKTMRILRIAFLSTATLELFSTLAIAIIAVYLGLGLLGFVHMGFSGVHITLFHALFILLLAPEFYMPLRQLGTFYHARSEAIGAANEIIKIIDTTQITEQHQTTINLPFENLDIHINNISFAYRNKNILERFHLHVQPNECIAITGPSGVGKSTLLHLIAKFIIPTEGNITVNGIDLEKINDDEWRDHIALLHQHPRLMVGTIEDNIRLAKPEATVDELRDAIQKSGISEFTQQLPQGLQTKINEQNTGLSGGQTQRVALARIILKNTPIILLDEPTAHLDETNVAIILQLLAEWRGKKTIVIATHDERIITMANRVIDL